MRSYWFPNTGHVYCIYISAKTVKSKQHFNRTPAEAKIQFAYSDILKESHKVHRITQFLRTLSGASSFPTDAQGLFKLSP